MGARRDRARVALPHVAAVALLTCRVGVSTVPRAVVTGETEPNALFEVAGSRLRRHGEDNDTEKEYHNGLDLQLSSVKHGPSAKVDQYAREVAHIRIAVASVVVKTPNPVYQIGHNAALRSATTSTLHQTQHNRPLLRIQKCAGADTRHCLSRPHGRRARAKSLSNLSLAGVATTTDHECCNRREH